MGLYSANLPNGINKDFLVPLSEVEKVIFTDKNMKFASLSEALTISKWKDKIQKDLSIFVIGGMYDYDVTTADPKITETASTRKIITDLPIPSAKILLETNYVDYQEILKSLKQGTYGVIYQLRDGTLLMRKNALGEIMPYTASLTAITKGIPLKATLEQNFSVYVTHTNYREFTEGVLVAPEWNVSSELLSYMPVGLSLFSTGPVVAGIVPIQVNVRGNDGFVGLLAADFEVLGSNGLVLPIVGTVVDNSNGAYTITLQKTAVPVVLAAGDYMIIRIKYLDNLVVSNISNRLYIQC